jgi:hypothetical protein
MSEKKWPANLSPLPGTTRSPSDPPWFGLLAVPILICAVLAAAGGKPSGSAFIVAALCIVIQYLQRIAAALDRD